MVPVLAQSTRCVSAPHHARRSSHRSFVTRPRTESTSVSALILSIGRTTRIDVSSEAGIVISGRLELWVDGKHFKLEEGDSFSFSSTSQHRCANPGKEPAKVVWVITPPHY